MLNTAQILGNLLLYDVIVAVGGFPALYNLVRKCSPSSEVPAADTCESVCRHVSQVCSWYPRRTLCLQRSAVLTCLLRRHGVPAELVIGASPMPFKAHAWVEVRGSVVNDKVSVQTKYVVLERC